MKANEITKVLFNKTKEQKAGIAIQRKVLAHLEKKGKTTLKETELKRYSAIRTAQEAGCTVDEILESNLVTPAMRDNYKEAVKESVEPTTE